jgi:hypothetical protein
MNTETDSTTSSQRNRRRTTVQVETKQHLQRITGFIALYFGIDAAYAFLIHLDVIPRPASLATARPGLLNDYQPSPLCLHTPDDLLSLCDTLASSLDYLSLNRCKLVGSKDSPIRQAKERLSEKLLEVTKQNKELSNVEATMMMPGNKEFRGFQFEHVKQMLIDLSGGYQVIHEDLIV